MSNWEFYKNEKEEHRWGLGKYAGEMKYVSAKSVWVFGETLAASWERVPFLKYVNDQCDNINLVEDGKGLFCNHCCHYHAKFTLKGLVKVYEGIPNRGYDTPAQTFINPGKFRSDWTDNDECWEDPFPTDPRAVDITPGEDFWQRIEERLAILRRKVEVSNEMD